MATIKIRFRQSKVKDNGGTLYYQIIHKRAVKQLYTDYRLRGDEWDVENDSVIIDNGRDTSRVTYLSSVSNGIRNGLDSLNSIVRRLESSGSNYTVEDVASAFTVPEGSSSGVLSFIRKLTEDLNGIGKHPMARRYGLILNGLLKFTEGLDIEWHDFNSTFVAGFEEFLRKRGLCRNSTSFYMRNLRSIVNRASENGFEVSGNQVCLHECRQDHKEGRDAENCLQDKRRGPDGLSASRLCQKRVPVCILHPGHVVRGYSVSKEERYFQRSPDVFPPQDEPADSGEAGTPDERHHGQTRRKPQLLPASADMQRD